MERTITFGGNIMKPRLRFGDLLNLIDASRDSEETISIINEDGKSEMKGMVRSRLWAPHEDRLVKSIQAEHYDLNVWLYPEGTTV